METKKINYAITFFRNEQKCNKSRHPRNIVSIMTLFVLTIQSFILISCNDTDENWNMEQQQCRVVLNANLNGFDNSTRTTTVWNDNDVLYIKFSEGSSFVYGKLIYNATLNEWSVTYNGSLTKGNCQVFFFSGDIAQDDILEFDAGTAIYNDVSAAYNRQDNILNISTTLIPTTSRIRFVGNPGTSFRVNGVEYYTMYNTNNGIISGFSNESVASYITDDGYSKYIYCTLGSSRTLTIEYDDCMYSTTLEKGIFDVGQSGSMRLPNEQNSNGWKRSDK